MKTTAIIGELQNHREIIRRVKAALGRGDFSLMIIFPTLSLLREIEAELLEQPEIKGLGGIRFLLFEGFINEIAGRFGLCQRKPTTLQRELLINAAFRKLDQTGRLSYLNRVPFTASYRTALLEGIAEWKRAGLTTDLFIKWAAEKGEKQQQLALIYFTYQHLLKVNGFCEADQLLEELKAFRSNTVPAVSRPQVLLYGYTDLTPLQSDFINVLSLWYEFEALIDPTAVGEFQSFTGHNFYWKNVGNTLSPASTNLLERLQQLFWVVPSVVIEQPEDDTSLQLLQADGWARQAQAIAREICALIRSVPNFTWNDFLILTPQPLAFIKNSYPIFKEYGLPLATPPGRIREFKDIIQFTQILRTVAAGWQWPDLNVLIRQFYTGFSARERDLLLVNLGKNYGALSGKARWVELLTNPDLKAELSRQGINLQPLEECIQFLMLIPENGTWEVYLQLARDWFKNAAIQALNSLSSEPALLQRQLWNYDAVSHLQQACEELLQNLELLTGMPATISLDEFRRFVEDYLLQGELTREEPVRAQLRVLPLQEARGLRAKVVFITGLEEGVFPRSYINDWKLSPSDRFDLKTLGVELETGATYQLQEKFAFYWALQAASQRLYLVERLQDDNGQPLNPSPFLAEISQWVPQLWTRAKYYPLEPRRRNGFDDCYSHFEERQLWIQYLLQAPERIPLEQASICDALFLDPGYRQLAVKAFQWRFRRRLEPSKPFYTHPGAVTILGRLGTTRPLAITALEEYRSCPFRFFLKQVLAVKPLTEPELLPEQVDLGNLYHLIFREFGEHYRGREFRAERRQEYWSFLEASFQRYFLQWQEKAANDLVKTVLTIRQRQIRQTLKRWLDAELEWAESTGYRYYPAFFEYSFGMMPGSGDPASLGQPFVLETPDLNVRLMGRIDRIDCDREGHFIVYDYKLGRGYSTGSILELKNLQLPIYILALEQLGFGAKAAAGGCYLSLKEPSRLSGGIWRRARIGIDGKSQGLLDDTQWYEWQEAVVKQVAATVNEIRSGYFHLTTETCPDYCEYRAACRRQEREEES